MYPIYNKFYYKPLPDSLEVKESPIEGLGLFAKTNIKKHFDCGMSHIKVPIICGFIRTSLGGFLNHSDTPNCQKIEVDGKYYLQTLKDIKKGEELTLKYTLYKVWKKIIDKETQHILCR